VLLSLLISSSESENVFILWAIHSSAIYPLLAEQMLPQAIMDAIRRRTVHRLSNFSPRSRRLNQDLAVLSKLEFESNSIDVLALAGSLSRQPSEVSDPTSVW